MHHEASLITTMALGFVFAYGLGYLADRLHLPPLVGYLLAGMLVGPHTPGHIGDPVIAGQLAEIGVILLMFGVGLHFSVPDLLTVRRIALPGAIIQMTLATFLGAGMCWLWGWTLHAGLLMGLSISVASTVVLLKALEERNLAATPNGRIAIGWLIVEDLAMVVVLALLPAFAGASASPTDETDILALSMDLGVTLAKVGAFLALVLLLGPKLLPRVLSGTARTGSRELFTLCVLAVALGVAYGASHWFGASFALGAFLAGIVLSESSLGHRAATESLPLQDAFSVLFFISIGMLFDPSVLVRNPVGVATVLALIIFGKSVVALAVITLLRYPIGTGLVVSACLAQIGEFSFILIGLGTSMRLVPAEAMDLIVAGALLSIMLNRLVLSTAIRLDRAISARAPGGLRDFGQARYGLLKGKIDEVGIRNEQRARAHSLEVEKLVEQFPILALADRREQERLLLLFRPRSAAPGEHLIRRGDRGDAMYFISSGAVEVTTDERVVQVRAGSYFGEMALLSGGRRTADVVAIDFCDLLVLGGRDFQMFTSRHPKVRTALAAEADRRQWRQRQGAPERSGAR